MSWRRVFDTKFFCAGLAALAAGIVLCQPLAGWAANGRPGVDGRLVQGLQPVPGGRVSAYLTIELAGGPAAVSPPAGPDGRYSLDLEPGEYYLTAEADQLWSWCGQNPITVGSGDRQWVGFSMTTWVGPEVIPSSDEGGDGSVTGRVTRDGKPVEDATVSLYFDGSDAFRGMGYLRSAPTGPDGLFRMDMVPGGSYYLLARKRDSGTGVGPMMKGDLISYYRFNPVRVEEGKELEVVLPMVAKRLEKDIHGSRPLVDRPGFEGTVTDSSGDPVQGVHVFAYLEPEMGHHKPAALSSITDGEGKYRIYLPGAGKYYVGARQGYGENPAPGEMFGHYEGTPDHSLNVEPSRYMTGIGITVKRVLIP